ncbi:hypothetical protein [Gloeocapsopsis dulcis]|uniref:Uncharacterized protein n=1 Tax=Gloeocapsopsis dulcis AAB1 = 1H9 TaxID=1433147 RepID=A0A6N8FYG1_9CHRO|nr:hypothetical protein [Gloeocapsopsis dulcis]MUL38178.1 hypothetical protein [Gloeocapsopsis dulcis AAB1 = 1H9]WNN90789.1 hypothetical protein P0S91_06855 [Gloeocapsopsis dulcis]
MNPAEIEATLQAAFDNCEAAGCALTQQQKEILIQAIAQNQQISLENIDSASPNPLLELTTEERRSFWEFIKEQQQQERDWKIQLLNDWLLSRDSGKVQFIRDRYGLQWLNRIKPIHIAEYAENEVEEALSLKVGDRIEVSNGLWEWVQETGPCQREWYSCTVLQIKEAYDENNTTTSCIVRLSNGAEYEIQGVYSWNRYNWRWAED